MEIGSVSRPLPGEAACGDQHVVCATGSATLIAVADGLGHGPPAAQAASVACRVVEANRGEELPALLRRCHQALRATRGAALTRVRIDQARARLWHVGVGNVEVNSASRERIRPIALPGVVGERVRKILQTDYELHPGDRLVIHSEAPLHSMAGHHKIAVAGNDDITVINMAEVGSVVIHLRLTPNGAADAVLLIQGNDIFR